MKIAVASQNRKQVTGHTGRCRRFWIYEVEAGRIVSRTLLELSIDQSFHAISPQATHPLDGVQVLISGGMGEGLVMRLARMGIKGLVTTESDPDRAVALYLAGDLPLGAPEAGGEHRRLRQEGSTETGEQA